MMDLSGTSIAGMVTAGSIPFRLAGTGSDTRGICLIFPSNRSSEEVPSLSVVAPLYNESQNVRPLVDWITQGLEGFPGSYEVVLVDDGSRDDTWAQVCAVAGPQV